jgi:hypothetical protein
MFTEPPFYIFLWTLFFNNLPKLINNVQQTPFLDLTMNTTRKLFAKVREQYSPNPLFRISCEHCSWTSCRSWWTMFTKTNPFLFQFSDLVRGHYANLWTRSPKKYLILCLQIKSEKAKLVPRRRTVQLCSRGWNEPLFEPTPGPLSGLGRGFKKRPPPRGNHGTRVCIT